MEYKIIVTKNAKKDIHSIIEYMTFYLCNIQAATNFERSLEHAFDLLKTNAESYQLCSNKKLNSLGYRRLHLLKSKYFMLYRVSRNIVFIDRIYHQLQDLENIIK